ncbi:UDP-glucose 4-epimerase GalE [Demequina muriae]|uniref:UDP-glucose 4-epimerase n=1 Tax=Demequina muriae TaxID=3051664 RepID=A0ABT8GFV1_9MICO|nr:UDP-glucose 4-epimerase GalE [Demequina sp. EGI L300058]MDN4480314.1 UDP-glucose 4-epimerase GalE [Demequina sp. EGI L300058]
MTWLVTGGAGYIGAHVAHAMVDAGLDVVALDNLSSGRRGFLPDTVPLGWVSVTDQDDVRDVMEENAITGVVHLAAFKYAGESVKRPLHTWRQNLDGTLSVLGAMQDLGIDRIVFSSTAAVYGTPDVDLVTEETPTHPESPYGSSKLAAERAIVEQAAARRSAGAPLRHTALRYFNVVGSSAPGVYDSSPHNLFPLVMDALSRGDAPRIFGTDYDTPDGTCVRDYVHVADVAAAHVVAAQALDSGEDLRTTYNLGSGTGTSVREIVDACIEAAGVDVAPVLTGRRPGDPARIVASGRRASHDLDWRMRHTVRDMVDSAWAAHPAAGGPARG